MVKWREAYQQIISDRIFRNRITTGIGILVAVLSAAGSEAQKVQDLQEYGSLLVSISSFIGAVALLLSKDKDNK